MRNEIKEFRLLIAASIYLMPCKENDLNNRFSDRYSLWGIGKAIQQLEIEEAIYYKGENMHVNKKWAKKNLKGFDIDFRSEKEKELDGLTDFAKELKKKGFI